MERRRAIAIDDQREALLFLEIPIRALVVSGKAAALTAGSAVGGIPGAVAAGIAYDSLTAAPFIMSGNEAPGSAAAAVVGGAVGGYAAGKVVEQAGLPPGLAMAAAVGYGAYQQGTDWLHQNRMLQATRTR